MSTVYLYMLRTKNGLTVNNTCKKEDDGSWTWWFTECFPIEWYCPCGKYMGALKNGTNTKCSSVEADGTYDGTPWVMQIRMCSHECVKNFIAKGKEKNFDQILPIVSAAMGSLI